jgi:hypothetical protein
MRYGLHSKPVDAAVQKRTRH